MPTSRAEPKRNSSGSASPESVLLPLSDRTGMSGFVADSIDSLPAITRYLAETINTDQVVNGLHPRLAQNVVFCRDAAAAGGLPTNPCRMAPCRSDNSQKR